MNSTTQQTSMLAFQNFTAEKKQKDHNLILESLEFNPDVTYHQIARVLNWSNPNKVSRRMPELVLAGKVEISGKKICPIAKSLCSTYKLCAI